MADIDALIELTEEERQKKKDKRIMLFKTLQAEATKKSRLNKVKVVEVKEEESK